MVKALDGVMIDSCSERRQQVKKTKALHYCGAFAMSAFRGKQS